MITKFTFLTFMAGVMKFVGLLLLGAGIYYGIYQGLFEPYLPNHSFTTTDFIELGAGLFALFLGVVSMVLAELVQVMLAIEVNTRNEQQEELETQQIDKGVADKGVANKAG